MLLCDKKKKLKADHTQIRGEKKRGKFTSNANFYKKNSEFDDFFLWRFILSVNTKSEKFYCADKDIQISIRSRGSQILRYFMLCKSHNNFSPNIYYLKPDQPIVVFIKWNVLLFYLLAVKFVVWWMIIFYEKTLVIKLWNLRV